jgi:hypothetical protein
MPSRLVRCSKCDGEGDDERGHQCTECRGAGVFRWGNEIPKPELASELAAVERILAMDEAEAKKALKLFNFTEGPEKAGRHRQLQHLNESVAYWKARKDFLKEELEAAPCGS